MDRNAVAFILFLGLFAVCGAVGHTVESYPVALAASVGVGFVGMVVGALAIYNAGQK